MYSGITYAPAKLTAICICTSLVTAPLGMEMDIPISSSRSISLPRGVMVTGFRGSKFEKMIPGIVASSCSSVVAVHIMEEGRGNIMHTLGVGWGLG